MSSDPHAAWARRLLPPTFAARLDFLPRVAGGVIALLLTLAVAGQLLSASRLRDVQRSADHARVTVGAPGDADQAAIGRTLAAELDGVADLQRTTAWLLAAAGVAALLLLAALARATRAAAEETVSGVSGAVDALLTGEPIPSLRDGEQGAMGGLHESLRRLSRQARANTEYAQALADGAFRRATMSRAPEDPLGIALVRVARSMESTALAAQRIARGDLSVRIAPQSDDDAYGESCSAMVRRVKHVLREVEEARGELTSAIAQLRAQAETLASATGTDADALRRAMEQLSRVALQANADAARTTALADRVGAGETIATDAVAQVEQSLAAMREVLQGAAGVQSLARDAGLLALEGSHGASAGEVEARARRLGAEARAVASSVTRLNVAASDAAHGAGLGLDRVRSALRDGASVVRELQASARDRADRLAETDGAVDRARQAAGTNAAAARELTSRIEALSAQVLRLDGVLRRFGRADRTVTPATVIQPLADMRGPDRGDHRTSHDFLLVPPMRMSVLRQG